MNDWQSQPPEVTPPVAAQPAPPPPPPGVQPASPAAPPPKPASEEFVGLPARSGGDKVFLLKGGKKHWVTSPEALANLGFKFGDVVKLDHATLSILPEGEPVR